MSRLDLDQHRQVQAVAKAVLAEVGNTICEIDTERSIASRAASLMAKMGISETWYYNCPAYVLLGSRSCASMSGRDYRPSDELVGDFNLVTVDLSPCKDGIWGDCARSFCIEDGEWTEQPATIEFAEGLAAEAHLHQFLLDTVSPEMTFESLFRAVNSKIASLGFENLDFRGNTGHTIETDQAKRRFIEEENIQKLGDAELFTFEPHIRKLGGAWGFKHENIYYFRDGRAQEL